MRTLIRQAYTTIATDFHIALKYSFALTSSFIIVFIIARLTGFYKITEFRFINYVLFFPIGFAAVQQAYKLNGDYMEYFKGMILGFLTGVMGQLWYAILFILYLSIDKPFLAYIITQLPHPLYYARLSLFFVFMVEGIGAGSILSLTLMQYFKWKRGRWGFDNG